MATWSARQPEQERRFAGAGRRAKVIGRWGDDTALLRIDDGPTVEVPVPEPLRDHFEVGDEVQLEVEDDRVVTWRAPHRA